MNGADAPPPTASALAMAADPAADGLESAGKGAVDEAQPDGMEQVEGSPTSMATAGRAEPESAEPDRPAMAGPPPSASPSSSSSSSAPDAFYLKLDPSAPAYVPGLSAWPWSSSGDGDGGGSGATTATNPMQHTVHPLQPIAENEVGAEPLTECSSDGAQQPPTPQQPQPPPPAQQTQAAPQQLLAPQMAAPLPSYHQMPPSLLQQLQSLQAVPPPLQPLQRANSMPNLIANAPPHPSSFGVANALHFLQRAQSATNQNVAQNVNPNGAQNVVPALVPRAVPVPLLDGNILDHNQIALRLRNVVNQNIYNANTMNIALHPQPPPPPQPLAATASAAAAAPTISASPTLLKVAGGVIPGVEEGLYWYHPQIDHSAVLLPAVLSDHALRRTANGSAATPSPLQQQQRAVLQQQLLHRQHQQRLLQPQ